MSQFPHRRERYTCSSTCSRADTIIVWASIDSVLKTNLISCAEVVAVHYALCACRRSSVAQETQMVDGGRAYKRP